MNEFDFVVIAKVREFLENAPDYSLRMADVGLKLVQANCKLTQGQKLKIVLGKDPNIARDFDIRVNNHILCVNIIRIYAYICDDAHVYVFRYTCLFRLDAMHIIKFYSHHCIFNYSMNIRVILDQK